MGRSPVRHATFPIVLASLLVASMAGCAAGARSDRVSLDYTPEAFTREVQRRVPGIPVELARAPFEVPPELVERAKKQVMRAPPGPDRVEALIAFLSDPEPEGLGLVYDWAATGSAAQTLELGRGNCVALASLMVGLGRGLRWPIYFAEARTSRPEEKVFEDVSALSDHMVVIVVPKTFSLIIDFTGLLDEVEDLRPIDDVTAYAHIVNNRSAQSLLHPNRAATPAEWSAAANGFRLATQIHPELGRAWNNLGIALSRLERFDEARAAYEQAMRLDTAFGSAERNLHVMETRLLGEATVGNATEETNGAPPAR